MSTVELPHQSFRLTSVPSARRLWRITIASWIAFALGAAHVAAGFDDPHPTQQAYERVAHLALSPIFGGGRLNSLITTLSTASGVIAVVVVVLCLIVGGTTGLITLIAAMAVSLKDSWGPPPEIESPLPFLSSPPGAQEPNHVHLLPP